MASGTSPAVAMKLLVDIDDMPTTTPSPFNYGPMISRQDSQRIVPFKVIVCGLMRTGTSSMQAALRILGIHDVYHMQSLVENPDDSKLWTRAMDAQLYGKKKIDRQEWDEYLGKYQAVCDAPAALFGLELAAAYPEAQVVILNRDVDSWYKSCLSTIHEIRAAVTLWQVALLLLDWTSMAQYARCTKKMQMEALGFEWPEEEKAKAFFHKYYADVRARIAPERVLEYRVQDGWAPLCKHLGVEVPMMMVDGKEIEVPFPRVNDTQAFKSGVAKILKESKWRAYRNAIFILGVIVGVGYISWKWKTPF